MFKIEYIYFHTENGKLSDVLLSTVCVGFFLEIYLPTVSKGQNSSKKQNWFCTENEIGSKYLSDINCKKFYSNLVHFIVVSTHLAPAFILLSLTRKMDVDFVYTYIHSIFLSTDIHAYAHIYVYEYMFNFYKITLHIYIFDLKDNSVHCIPYKAPQPEATKTPV